MKYSKYLDLTACHPFVEEIVWDNAGCDADKTERDIKKYVRERLSYVAYRPWEKLDLASRNVFDNLGHVPHAYAHQCFCTSVSYHIYFWIDGDKGKRMRSVSWQYEGSVGEYTVADVIKHIREWYKSCWREFQGKPLRWEAVVKHSSSGGVCVSAEWLEVYPFPENF